MKNKDNTEELMVMMIEMNRRIDDVLCEIEEVRSLINDHSINTRHIMVANVPNIIIKNMKKLIKVFFGQRINVHEVAALMGKSPAAIYKMMERKQIKYRKTESGTVYFVFSDLKDFLTEGLPNSGNSID